MEKYLKIIQDSFTGYFNYLVQEITTPSWTNYFYWLIAISLVVWILEIALPWRKSQPIFRKGFWLDGFYILFNFFLFSLIGYNALSNVGVALFNDFLGVFGSFRACLDMSGPVRIRSDLFGCVLMVSDAFGRIWARGHCAASAISSPEGMP